MTDPSPTPREVRRGGGVAEGRADDARRARLADAGGPPRRRTSGAGLGILVLRPADVAAAGALEGLEPSTRRLLERDATGPDHRWLTAHDTGSGELVGVAGACDVAGDAHVLDVAVHPRRRRHGIGTALVRALLVAARDELGCRAATLEVRATNAGALALYRRLGFEVAGTRPGYYPPDATGAREDALVLWCDDLDRRA